MSETADNEGWIPLPRVPGVWTRTPGHDGPNERSEALHQSCPTPQLTKHDEHVAYYGHLMEREIKAEAQEARHLIDTEVFSPTVEKHIKRSALPKLPLSCDMDAAVRKDVADIDSLLDEIVGPVPDVAAEINQADLKPLADIVAVVNKFGRTRVGKVLVALQPPPRPPTVLPVLD